MNLKMIYGRMNPIFNQIALIKLYGKYVGDTNVTYKQLLELYFPCIKMVLKSFTVVGF